MKSKDCGCNSTLPERDFVVKQIQHRIKSCEGSGLKNVYPRSITQAIFDVCTGERLDSLLSWSNHIHVPYLSSLETTLLSVPTKYRRKGLVISYINPDLSISTKRYTILDTDDEKWSSLSHWEDVYTEPHSVGNVDLTLIEARLKALEDDVDNDTVFDPTALIDRITRLENRRDNDTIYDDTEIRNKIAQLESRPPVTNQYDDSRLLNKIAELEGIINELKSKEDSDTIYNDRALIERIEALEDKTDNDTIFDPSSINDRLERLENKADANKFVNGSEWIDDNHIRLFFNDGSSMDIKRNAPVIRRFNLSVGENLTSTKLNGQYDEGTEVSVTAKTNIRGKRFVKIVDSVAGDITSTSHTFRLTEDRTITAVYEDLPRYNITGEGVRISDSNPFQGENVSINVTIPSGKTLREVVDSVDGNKGAITSYRFAATSDRHIVATFDEIPKPKIYFGFQEGYDADMSLEASKESFAEVENLPYEVDFYPTMPDNANGTHGYFGVAIDKELSPSSAPKLQTLFAGNWTDILSGAIKVTEEQIDGKPYWLIVGTQKTRKFNSGASHFKLKVTI